MMKVITTMFEVAKSQKTDLLSVLKAEITRLARKELRAELEPMKNAATHAKAQVAALRAEVGALQKKVKRLEKQAGRVESRVASNDQEPSKQRFTAKGFASLRARLGISRAQMGQLIGASGVAVRKWEEGENIPRVKYQVAIFALRGKGKREIAERLLDDK